MIIEKFQLHGNNSVSRGTFQLLCVHAPPQLRGNIVYIPYILFAVFGKDMFLLIRLMEVVTKGIDLPEYYVLSCCSMKQTQLKQRNVEVVMVLKLQSIRKYSILWKQIAIIYL
jgi:hypothetical protein